jgi:uncharacterized protein YndB with AHSA1/START domain
MSALDTFRQDEELVFDMAIDEPPQKLWRALTEPAIVERWLAPLDTKAEPNRSASYIWRDPEAGESMVTFAISERVDGFSRLSIVHTGLPRVFTVATAGISACTIRCGTKTMLPAAANRNKRPLLAA